MSTEPLSRWSWTLAAAPRAFPRCWQPNWVRGSSGFSAQTGSQQTPRWRKPDSNPRSLSRHEPGKRLKPGGIQEGVFRTSISRLPSGNDLRRFGILPCQIREARRSRRYHLARAYAVIGPRRETGATSRLSIGHLVTFEGIAGEMIRPSAFESSATQRRRAARPGQDPQRAQLGGA